MKKSEITQITQIVEFLVAKEIKKQLPKLIGEVFQNMAGKSVVNERQPINQPIISEDQIESKLSMMEMFSDESSIEETHPTPPPKREMKQYTKDQKINAILNETVSDLRRREGLVGAAAFHGGYSPGMTASPDFGPISTGAAPMLIEGQESSYAPMASIPQGVSALDVVKQVPIAAPVAQALTRNYSQMMKLIDSKRKGKI